MLLSYIDDLLESKKTYEYTYSIYEELIEKWINREANRREVENKEKFKAELYKFSQAIALDIYHNRRKRNGLFIGGEVIKPFAEEHEINLEEIEMRSRSLLNRNAQGQCKFSHKSILEYFLALELLRNQDFFSEFSFEEMDQAKNFYDNMRLSMLRRLADGTSIDELDIFELREDLRDAFEFLTEFDVVKLKQLLLNEAGLQRTIPVEQRTIEVSLIESLLSSKYETAPQNINLEYQVQFFNLYLFLRSHPSGASVDVRNSIQKDSIDRWEHHRGIFEFFKKWNKLNDADKFLEIVELLKRISELKIQLKNRPKRASDKKKGYNLNLLPNKFELKNYLNDASRLYETLRLLLY